MSHQPHDAPTPEQGRTALAIHAATYLVVNLVMASVDLKTGRRIWFHWPLLGWGAGLAWIYRFQACRAVQAHRNGRAPEQTTLQAGAGDIERRTKTPMIRKSVQVALERHFHSWPVLQRRSVDTSLLSAINEHN